MGSRRQSSRRALQATATIRASALKERRCCRRVPSGRVLCYNRAFRRHTLASVLGTDREGAAQEAVVIIEVGKDKGGQSSGGRGRCRGSDTV